MKQLSFVIVLIIWLLCSCNKNSEPDLEIELPISSVFIPVSIEINKNDINDREREEIMNLVNNKHIVNNLSELPSDPIGQNEAFNYINFKEQTLLMLYLYKRWAFETYSNRFYKNTKENSYNWVVKLGAVIDYDDDRETVQLTRFAILVRKLPVDADVQTWYSQTQLRPNAE